MKNATVSLVVAAAASLLAGSALAQSQLTVVNFGGANGNAQKKAYVEPFEKATGTKIVGVEYNGEQAKIKAMVETKKVTWDVVEVESPDAARGCDEGLFEKIDWAKVGNKADFQPAAVQECGVGIFIWSTVMAYNGDKLKDGPKTWADFWDTRKFAGKRGMRKGARYNLEFALMADGVKPADVYKVLASKDGAERAFKKLTELKPNIQWWEAGAQPPQFLVAGDVTMTTAFNGDQMSTPAFIIAGKYRVKGKNLEDMFRIINQLIVAERAKLAAVAPAAPTEPAATGTEAPKS